MKIAAAYIRVSTEGQDEYSPDSQLKLCREYARKNEYLLPEEFIFYDDGVSAKTTKKRIQFNKMIALAKDKSRPFSAILVWKYSRFARNQEESIVYKSLLKKNGVSVISISEQIDGKNPFGSLIERIIEWMDEYYLVRLSGEVKRGMLEKFSRGQIVNAPPIGYSVNDGKYVPDQNAELIKLIYDNFLEGASYNGIARKLNNSGYRTVRGNFFESRTIEYIIRNPVYTGKLRRTSDTSDSQSHTGFDTTIRITDGEHEPIISDEIWNQAQIRAEKIDRRYRRYSRAEVKNDFMLRGLLRCSSCGAVLVNSNKGYQCHKYSHGLCEKSHYISKTKINSAIISALISKMGNISISIENKSFPKNRNANIESEDQKLFQINKPEHTTDTISQRDNLRNSEINACCTKSFIDFINNPRVNEAAINAALREFIDKIVFFRENGSVSIYIYA